MVTVVITEAIGVVVFDFKIERCLSRGRRYMIGIGMKRK
jgi:hypothetical protein